MTLRVWGLVGLLRLACAGQIPAGPRASLPSGLFVQNDAGLLTIQARSVPQRRIPEALARHLHFELSVMGPLEERQSLNLERRPWEEGLKIAPAPASWAALYRSATGSLRLSHLWGWPRSQESPTGVPSPVPSSPTPEDRSSPTSTPGLSDFRALLAGLLAAENDETRAVALAALVNVGGEPALGAATQALHDEEPWGREIAVEALASIGGEPAIHGLQQALQDDNAGVRQAAQGALARLTMPSWMPDADSHCAETPGRSLHRALVGASAELSPTGGYAKVRAS